MFVNAVPNVKLCDVTRQTVEEFLAKRTRASARTKNGDRLAVSRFLSWCLDHPRKWIGVNPCLSIKVVQPEAGAPVILNVEQCRALLKQAEKHRKGRLAPYFAICLFGGLRPSETSRLNWTGINLHDSELRLEGSETKTRKPRVVHICPTLRKWLLAYQDRPIIPVAFKYDFRLVIKQAGIKWTPDVLRHTCISHHWRLNNSYGLAAAEFGTSEGIIKAHYQARVSSAETAKFYKLLPSK
jgi:integrase